MAVGVLPGQRTGIQTMDGIHADTKGDFHLKEYNLDLNHPVGSIYMSSDPTSPAELFGGSWEKIEDRVVVGASERHPVNSTGGEETHKLTIQEMPSHDHKGELGTEQAGSSPVALMGYKNLAWNQNISKVGGDQPHNNMQPYIAFYTWRRVS